MLRKYHFTSALLTLLLISVGALAQNEDILLSVGNSKVSKAEFEHIYRKNNNNLFNEADKKSPAEYLELFIDFKLKVEEAESLKMDTAKVFITELAGYREEIAAPYLTDVKYEEELVHELYERMKQEVNASHILLRLEKNNTPEQEAEVLEKIASIRQEILDGKDFGTAAVEYSQDPSAKSNKGNLGFFTAFMMVAPFENAAFTTPVGDISQPVRSSFGYHLIKVHEIRENQGEIQVAHIMKAFPRNATPEDKQKAKAEIDSIYQQLKSGADFAELAQKESMDKQTAVKGGVMPWFAAGRIIPEFSNAAFALQSKGDFSQVIETKFGYHIIKKLDQRKVKAFDVAKADIEAKIKSDPERRTSSKKVFIEKLKKEYAYSENAAGKDLHKGVEIQSEDTIPNVLLFTIDDKNYGTKELSNFIKEKNIKYGQYTMYFERWADHEITRLEDNKLEEKYPEFRYLMNEYHDGILLFNISQEKIWNLAGKDTIGLERFYESNKTKHQWKERFKGNIITCISVEAREQAENLLGEEMTLEDVAQHLNTETELITYKSGAWEEGRNEVVDYYVWNGKEPENFNSALTFIRGDKIAPEPKLLDEARGLYISDYQHYLEKQWLKELRSKYKVKVNKKLLRTIEEV